MTPRSVLVHLARNVDKNSLYPGMVPWGIMIPEVGSELWVSAFWFGVAFIHTKNSNFPNFMFPALLATGYFFIFQKSPSRFFPSMPPIPT